MFRVPSWAEGATLQVNGATPTSLTPGGLQGTDCQGTFDVTLTFPMKIRVQRRYNNAASVYNG